MVLLSAVAIVALTLHPAESGQVLSRAGLCLICGEFGLANLLSNVLLFVPLGVGLGLSLSPGFRAVLPAVLLSAGIELAQLAIPGRNPLPADWVANSLGGGLGVVFAAWGWRRVVVPQGRRSVRPFFSVLALSAAVLVGTTAAYRLVPPEPPHYVQWTPVLGHFDTYGGRILEATLAGEPTPQGRHPRPRLLEARLLDGAPLEVEVEAGPPPDGLGPIFNVFTGDRRELLVLGARGDALAVRLPFLAGRLRLARPEFRAPGMLAGLEPGERFRLRFRMSDRGACLTLTTPAKEEVCGLRPTVADGWALLHFPGALREGGRTALGWIWLAGIGLLAGFFAPSGRWALVGAGGLAGIGALAPSVTGSFAWTPSSQSVLLGLAALAGYAGVRAVVGSWVEGRGRTTHVAGAQHDGAPPAHPTESPSREG